MTDLRTLEGHGVRCVISTQPVTRESYKRYLRETRQAVPRPLTQPAPGTSPVIYVSQVSARAYCKWLASQEGHAYRLPTMAELLELYDQDVARDGFSADLWPHQAGSMREVRGGLKAVFLCEWSNEAEEIPQPDPRPPRVLGSIFYPPWLQDGQNATHAQAHLQATEGYSFVTFRVAADN